MLSPTVIISLLVSLLVFSQPNSQSPSTKPLLLSPYIRSNKIDEAQKAARVENLPNAPKILSYSGYITVNEKTNSNLFFWFFPSKVNNFFLDSTTSSIDSR